MKRLRIINPALTSSSYKMEEVYAVALVAATLQGNSSQFYRDEFMQEQEKLEFIRQAQSFIRLAEGAVGWGIEEYEEEANS